MYVHKISIENRAFLGKYQWPTKQERERLKPVVQEEPPELNTDTSLKTQPGRTWTVWGDGQACSF